MTITNNKKERVRLVLIIAIALGCSSATLSGTLAVFEAQHPMIESGLA